jgi:hypothetical protein
MRAFGCSGSQVTSAALQQRHGVEASRYVHGNAYRTTHGCEHSMRWSRAVSMARLDRVEREGTRTPTAQDSENGRTIITAMSV